MNEKQVELGHEAREQLLQGIDKMYNAVKCTLGPMGKTVIIKQTATAPVHITKDGVTVAKSIVLSHPLEDLAVQSVKEAAMKTADDAGDGTTTATVLAANIISKGVQNIKSGSNPIRLKQGIDIASSIATKFIASKAKQVEYNNDEIKNIATISANNDPTIGALIAEGMSKVKSEGTIVVETSKTSETTIEVVEGMKLNRGYVSPYFITDPEKMKAVMKEPYILCADTVISNMQEMIPILEGIAKSNASLVIFANEIEGEALSAMILNKVKGLLNVVAIKTPHYGDVRKEIIKDIATVVGAQVVSPDTGVTFENILLGKASSVIVTKDSTTIIGGAGKAEDIQVRIAQTKSQMDGAKYEHDKEMHKQRLARLSGGVAVLYIGAATELEMKEKRDRVDDALHATRAALDEGVIAGGGILYTQAANEIATQMKTLELHEDVLTGMKIMKMALQKPFEIIIENAGLNSEIVQSGINQNCAGNDNYGYDAKADKYGDMYEMGIIDPAKVARIAIETAVSIANTFITTECVIVPEKFNSSNLAR